MKLTNVCKHDLKLHVALVQDPSSVSWILNWHVLSSLTLRVDIVTSISSTVNTYKTTLLIVSAK